MADRSNPIEVLIVEDDRRVAEIHRRFTEKVEDFHVAGMAHTGEEAREWLQIFRPDLVLLDIYLPDIKGIDLIWFIREHARKTDIIMITAAGETDLVQEAMRGGVVDYMVKPIVFERFRTSLEQYRAGRERLAKMESMDQDQIDALRNRSGTIRGPKGEPPPVPKGIDPITLEKVIQTLRDDRRGKTAEETGRAIGASRSTARRYLEYLVSMGEASADVSYGAIGRPERRYGMRKG
ncbi:response regulator [Desmospora profundinema]|uniref:Transcriptional regulatory protein n=1 Tax=Desmospora profundinema TaxID=1571184 RepID=A0ABU1IN48_9BACL|nr:response regulator [Desmospora profundinema]MDR6226197.1 two-component system CitB family response regulator [Desmospora profundinema]